jgi:hypothetical protein
MEGINLLEIKGANMQYKNELATVQIGKEFIPVLKKLAKLDSRSMRKYIEHYIITQAKQNDLLKK